MKNPLLSPTLAVALLAELLGAGPAAHAAESRPGLQACRLPGVTHEAFCGVLRRPLDPAQPQGTQIDVHYAVLPALARNRRPDPVLFFAGGPGQSAMSLAGPVGRMLTRLSNRRDVVLIDQRGTGRSAPLFCDEVLPGAPLAEAADTARQIARLQACGVQLQKLPYGDLRHYTTWVAMQDADAVRQALGAAQVNLVGGSYGTRAVLEYMRQFPQAVRRAVIDGVAPADMVLPASFSTDNQAALDAVFAACEGDDACRQRHPALRTRFTALLGSLPRDETLTHPLTGRPERVTLTRDGVLGLVRGPLYVPALAAALPQAMADAAGGRFDGLLGLASAFGSGGGRAMRVAEGMHFSVVCAEDLPRMAQAVDAPGADFGQGFAAQYRRICEGWPRGVVPAAFYTLPSAPAATLVLSGGADPATPSRHGDRVAKALGAKARHVVVPQAGHGVLALPCMRDVLFRFIDAEADDAALQVEADCARQIPRPPAFVPLLAGGV
ncbi:MAG: alpha/beta fold hydrolase [Rubrivivax sp.]|nr:alpha/beta fold hydrolase [Rubrivivax sp.]